jgi:hypothetical protein
MASSGTEATGASNDTENSAGISVEITADATGRGIQGLAGLSEQ